MNWEIGHTDAQIPFVISVVVHVFSSAGIVMLEGGKSIFWKSFIFQLGGFLLSLLPSAIFNKLLCTRISKDSHDGKSTFFASILSLKMRGRLRLLLASCLLSISLICFLHGRSSSVVVNASIYSLLKVSVCVFSNGVRSSRLGRIIFITCMVISIGVVAFTSMKIISVALSFVCLFMAVTYWKLLVPTFHNEKSAISAVLICSATITAVFGLLIERFHFDFAFFKTLLAGIFTLSTPTLLILIKKSSSTLETKICYTFLPLLVASGCNLIGQKTETPLVLYLGVVIAFIGCHSLDLTFHETVVFKPFATNRSGLGFIISILVIATALVQYIANLKSGEVWRMGDAVYLILSLRWTLSDVIRTIQKSTSSQFSYGFGRIRYILMLTLGTFGIFSSFFVISNCLVDRALPHQRLGILSLITHIVLPCFFLWSPRAGMGKKTSIRNAVNFSAGASAFNDNKSKKYNPIDIVIFILMLIGSFVHGFMVDRLISFVFVTVAFYLSIPMIKDSVHVLLQSTSPLNDIKQLRNEIRQCTCVLDIVQFNVWQNDDALSVASIMLKIDERVCSKPQDFLMYVISLCQQAGILDVTVEIVNRELVPLVSSTIRQPNYFRNTPSPI